MPDAADSTVAAVVFDYGGVLTTPVQPSVGAWLAREGIDPESFRRAMRSWMSRSAVTGSPVHLLETGDLDEQAFDVLLADELVALDGTPVSSDGLVRGMLAGMRPDPDMFALVQDIRAAGVAVALLSNSWGDMYPHELLDEHFDVIVISGQVRMRKPDEDIFEHTLALLGLEPGRVAFVDDSAANVEGAARLGMVAVLHADHESTRARLAMHVPALG